MFVIPAQAGIQYYLFLVPGFRRDDGIVDCHGVRGTLCNDKFVFVHLRRYATPPPAEDIRTLDCPVVAGQ
jgi:hypothetical protein